MIKLAMISDGHVLGYFLDGGPENMVPDFEDGTAMLTTELAQQKADAMNAWLDKEFGHEWRVQEREEEQ